MPNNSNSICLAYVTCPNEEVALKLGHELVEKQRAACANIIPGMKSIYPWEGKIERASEVILILKTTEAAYSELEQAIVALHPYEVPCVLKLPVDAGNPAYINWLKANVPLAAP